MRLLTLAEGHDAVAQQAAEQGETKEMHLRKGESSRGPYTDNNRTKERRLVNVLRDALTRLVF